jgi:cystathionine beta-lyase/cystathionine gamma-synthase
MKESTIAIHRGRYPDPDEGGINTPIYASSSHLFPHPSGILRYPRYSNTPTQLGPAEKIAGLENGDECEVFSSGMAAVTTIFLSMLRKGDHCVVQENIYGGTYKFLTGELIPIGIEVSFVGSNDPDDFKKAIKENTRLLYIESPSNPILRLIDIKTIARIAGERGIISVIDNTFATPINQKPLDMGIDIVVHSGTKYLNGHTDIACGAVIANATIMKRIRDAHRSYGGSLDVFSSFLLDRGLKTLPLRMERHNKNALQIARYLEKNSKIEKVYYPGLESHPEHELAKRQMSGYGGMVSFTLTGTLDVARKFAGKLSIIKSAVSLGGVESIICFPFETSHAGMEKKVRESLGIYDTTLRLSVGIEDAEDLISDLDGAFQAI